MQQFSIWMAQLPVTNGNILRGMHPVIVVSNNLVNRYSPVITAIPLTSKLKRWDLQTHVLIRGQGLACDSMALCEQILTLDRTTLVRRMGHIVNAQDRKALIRGIGVQLGLVH